MRHRMQPQLPTALIALGILLTACQNKEPLTPRVEQLPIAAAMNGDPELAGQVLAFASDRLGFFNVFVMKANGSSPTPLTFMPGYNGRPNWSHDGRKITFTACRETDTSCEIYVMNAD